MRFRKILLIIIHLGFVSFLTAQQSKYDDLILKAVAFHDEEEYEKSLATYEQAFKLRKRSNNEDFYNAACAAARIAQIEKSFAFLAQSIQSGFWNYRFMKQDEDLKRLHHYPEWQTCKVQIVKAAELELAPYLKKITLYRDSLAQYLIPFRERKKNLLFGYLDKRTNQVVVEPVFSELYFMDKLTRFDYKSGRFFFHQDGILSVVDEPIAADPVLKPECIPPSNEFTYYNCFQIAQKKVIISAKSDQLMGITDETGTILWDLPFKFRIVEPIQKDIGIFFYVEEGSDKGIRDTMGNSLTSHANFKIASLPLSPKSMFCDQPVKDRFTFLPIEKQGKQGVIQVTALNPFTSKIILPMEYDFILGAWINPVKADEIYFEVFDKALRLSFLVDNNNKRYFIKE